ncbi:MAG: FkbM family methyltransferase, partial [Thermomicrobiales bacterium]
MSALSERLLGLVQRLFEKSANVGLGSGRMGRAWRKAFFLFGQSRVLTRTRFHGASVVVPAGHPYQVFLNRYPTYNTPILVAIDLAWRGLPLTYCDVGAGVGDTMILARSTNRIGVTIGIDGDESFLKLARRNLDSVASCELICSMLTGRDGDEIRGLEPVHAGTRTAIGDWASEGVSLDTVLAGRSVDILKVDVDGYDGQVLQGAGDTLGRYSPIVVFEYHPALIDGVGQTRSLPWDALGLAGYDRAIAFDKFGLL